MATEKPSSRTIAEPIARWQNLMRTVLRREGDEAYILIVGSYWGRCQPKKWKAASRFGTRVLPSVPLAAVVAGITKALRRCRHESAVLLRHALLRAPGCAGPGARHLVRPDEGR